MSFERARVAEVWASRGSGGKAGSGYLISDRHVLTAAHVLEPALHNGADTCEVRCLGEQEWSSGRIVWHDAIQDLALVELVEQRQTRVAPVRWGRILGNQPVDCTAVGFPDAQARPDHTREPEQVMGRIAPLTTSKDKRLAVHVLGSAPTALTTGSSPWGGMSGAVVFVGSVLVGVVVVDPANFGTDRLSATPVSLLAGASGFAKALEPVGVELNLEPVPQIDGVEFPRRHRLPAPGRRSPSMLLRPEFAVVPFRGRQAELDSWVRWCAEDTDAPFVRLLIASAGVGKTRFATELAGRMDAASWFTGFVTDRAADTVIAQVAALGAPGLLVVDYAETRPNLAVVLAPLAHRDPREIPVRVLLLARGAGDWWEQLQHASAHMEFLLGGQTALELGPVDPVVSDRAAAFDEAARAFAAVQRLDVKQVLIPNLSHPEYEAILFVHTAALNSVGTPDEQGPGAGARAELPVLTAMREREARYWQRTARAKGVLDDQHVLEQIVLLATLIGADNVDEAVALLRRVPDLQDAGELQRRALARWCHDLEPYGPEWLAKLQPDALAEELTAHVLINSPVLGRTAFHDLPRERATKALTVLDRASRRQPELEDRLFEILEADLERLAPAAMEVAAQTGDPIGRVLASILEHRPESVRELAQLHEQIPQQTVALREVAVLLTAAAIATAREGDSLSALAVLLNSLSARLSDLGRREEALAAIQEAVEIHRDLAAASPDVFRAGLAQSLNNLSNRLSSLGRPEEALEAIQEAVQIRRELVVARPDAFRPDLAQSLNTLSIWLSALGRQEEALLAIQEAMQIYRQLVVARPDAFRRDLATGLNNLSIWLSDLGRREEALAAIQEAIQIYRELAATRPDAFRPDLAQSLNNLSNRLSSLGRGEEALAAIQEAIQIQRELAATRPDAFRPDLAQSLNTLSNRLSSLGRREEALAAIQEAVSIRRELTAARPDAYRHDLAMSLNNLSNRLSSLGRREEALEAVQEAVSIRRQLTAARPDVYRHDLAMSLNNLSNRLSSLGRREEALAAIQEAVTIYRELAAARPDAFGPALAASLNTLSIHLANLGRPEEALAAIQETVTIRRELAAAHPNAFGSDLAASLNALSNHLANLGRPEEVLAAIQEAIQICRRLVAARSDAFPTDLAQSLDNLSSYLATLGRLDEAHPAVDEALDKLRELAIVGAPPHLSDLVRALLTPGQALEQVGRDEKAEDVHDDGEEAGGHPT